MKKYDIIVDIHLYWRKNNNPIFIHSTPVKIIHKTFCDFTLENFNSWISLIEKRIKEDGVILSGTRFKAEIIIEPIYDFYHSSDYFPFDGNIDNDEEWLEYQRKIKNIRQQSLKKERLCDWVFIPSKCDNFDNFKELGNQIQMFYENIENLLNKD